MDLNQFLRNTKTAGEDDKSRLRAVLSGHQRLAGATELPSPVSSSSLHRGNKFTRRSGAAEGLNIQAVQAGLLSEQAAARMAHQVLEYVVQVELGGRHNAAKGGIAPFVPPAAQLAAEKAMSTPAAGYVIHHILPASLDPTPRTLESLVSVTEKERVSDGVQALRGTLHVCDTERDLVGGVRAGMAPHLRAHVLEVLEKGLRGQAWLRDDAAVATQISALGRSTTPEKKPSSVLLFSSLGGTPVAQSEVAVKTCGASLALEDASKQQTSSFSLEAFLGAEDSASSSAEVGEP